MSEQTYRTIPPKFYTCAVCGLGHVSNERFLTTKGYNVDADESIMLVVCVDCAEKAPHGYIGHDVVVWEPYEVSQ